jgi:hypothetical protein
MLESIYSLGGKPVTSQHASVMKSIGNGAFLICSWDWFQSRSLRADRAKEKQRARSESTRQDRSHQNIKLYSCQQDRIAKRGIGNEQGERKTHPGQQTGAQQLFKVQVTWHFRDARAKGNPG